MVLNVHAGTRVPPPALPLSLPRWPSNGLSPMGPQREPGPGADPAELERLTAARNGPPAGLRVPAAHISPRRHARAASYPSECRVAGGLSGGERPVAPRSYVNNSAEPDDGVVDPEDLRRRERLALRSVGRRISRLKSRPRDGSEPQYTIRKCGVVRITDSGNVRLKVVNGKGYAEGVMHCGSIWGCAVCAAVIRNGRAQIYGESAARWLAAGNTILMVTVTFPHSANMALDPLWDLVSKGVSRLTSSVRWRNLTAEVAPESPAVREARLAEWLSQDPKRDPADLPPSGEVYYRRAIEQTYGLHGWHPHCHMLLYVRGDAVTTLPRVDQYFRAEWPKWITSQCVTCHRSRRAHGLKSRRKWPSDDGHEFSGYRVPNRHGVDVKPCYSAADGAEYIVKTQDGRGVGNELVRSDMKTAGRHGRTPFEILADAGKGDEKSVALWREFEKASQGRRAITQSQGLADVLGERDATDEELAGEPVGGDAVAEVAGKTWDAVIRKEIEAPVFEAAPRGLAAVNDVLRMHKCGPAYVPVLREKGS